MSFLVVFFKNPTSWVSVLAPPLLLYLEFGFLHIILTSAALVLSTFFFISSAQNRHDKSIEAEAETAKGAEAEGEKEEPIMDATFPQTKEDEAPKQEEKVRQAVHPTDDQNYFVSSPDSSIGSESLQDQSSNAEDSECESWPFRENTDFSDGTISDEESLIELSLPSGHYVGHGYHYKKEKEEKGHGEQEFSKLFLEQKLQDFTPPQSIFPQRTLMELLAEFNEMIEEDNLIEIDLSMGSIKCSRFEIEA